jgi:hypothetical protein
MSGAAVKPGSGEPERPLRCAVEQGPPVEGVAQEAAPATLRQPHFDETAWRRQFRSLLASIRRDLPADIPPERIEADITAARDQVRQAQRAARYD